MNTEWFLKQNKPPMNREEVMSTTRKGRERDYQREYMREYRKDLYNKHMEQKRDRERKRKVVVDPLFQSKVEAIKRRAKMVDEILSGNL